MFEFHLLSFIVGIITITLTRIVWDICCYKIDQRRKLPDIKIDVPEVVPRR